jgi:hypothetical protein
VILVDDDDYKSLRYAIASFFDSEESALSQPTLEGGSLDPLVVYFTAGAFLGVQIREGGPFVHTPREAVMVIVAQELARRFERMKIELEATEKVR